MPPPTLEQARPVTFDLEHGEIRVAGDEPHVLVPVSTFVALLTDPSKPRDVGRSVGIAAMERVAARLLTRPESGSHSVERHGSSSSVGRARRIVRAQSLETVVDLLGRELALLGFGNLRVERWGKAMLFVLDPCSLPERVDPFIEGVFEGALASVASREVYAIVVDRAAQTQLAATAPSDGSRSRQLDSERPGMVRVLVAGESAMMRAAPLVAQKIYFTDVVRSIHDAELSSSMSSPSRRGGDV